MPAPSLNRERAVPFRDDRHYFHRPTWVGAWRVRLVIVAMLAAGAWLAVSMIRRDTRYVVCTHGELARAHAPWADRCDACHVSHGEPDGPGNGLFETRDRWRTFRCESCHAGPANDTKNYAPHYDRVAKPHLADDAQSRDCSSCHHDHQGANFALARVADTDCTRCHTNLSPLHAVGPSITAFHTDHPEFRAKTSPPTRGLKFNHALHLATGMTEKANLDNPNAAFKLGQVDQAYRQQYQRFASGDSPAAALTLECNACHEPSGSGYKPIEFDRHCQGCHALTVSKLQSPTGITTESFTVRHGRPLPELERQIRAEILRQIDSRSELLRKVPLPPSDRLDPPRVAVPSNLGAEADMLAESAHGLMTCQKCHELAGGNVRPTATPALWLPAARFDHPAHRAMKCDDCHTNWAGAKIVRAGPPEPLNVPGIDNCRQCHAPTGHTGIAQAGDRPMWERLGLPGPGGVRHNCVDCHRYHRTRHP